MKEEWNCTYLLSFFVRVFSPLREDFAIGLFYWQHNLVALQFLPTIQKLILIKLK